MSEPTVPPPRDTHDLRRVERVRPPDWKNPAPAPRYNLVVLGAGTAGLVAAAGAAGLGARVALVERGLLGGDCLNTGCVPSKALLRSARAAAAMWAAAAFGVRAPDGVTVDFAAVMTRMRRLRADIAANDAAVRFRGLGVDVFLGEGRFTASDRLTVEGVTLRFHRAVIATGGYPTIPPIPGLVATSPLTSETVFELDALPARLAVIGGGPIGCELAQAFARFGAAVTLVEQGERLLANDDPDAAAIVASALARDGVALELGTEVVRVESSAGARRLTLRQDGEHRMVDADAILVAVGRTPSVADLGLEAAGVAFDARRGIIVDDRLRTTNRRIYAAGDVCGGLQFTHLADAQARVVLRNALFLGRQRASALTVPWCTYTDPEVAHVGHTAATAAAAGIDVETYTHSLAEVDRAVLDGETAGFARVHLRKGSEEIVGATVVAAHGGEMIGELALAMTAGVGLGAIARTIFPYPTQAEVWKRLADAHQRARLTPRVARLLRWWLALRR